MVSYHLNPFTAKDVLIDFTLSNARRFYSSKGSPLAVKGLNISSGSPRLDAMASCCQRLRAAAQMVALAASVDGRASSGGASGGVDGSANSGSIDCGASSGVLLWR